MYVQISKIYKVHMYTIALNTLHFSEHTLKNMNILHNANIAVAELYFMIRLSQINTQVSMPNIQFQI